MATAARSLRGTAGQQRRVQRTVGVELAVRRLVELQPALQGGVVASQLDEPVGEPAVAAAAAVHELRPRARPRPDHLLEQRDETSHVLVAPDGAGVVRGDHECDHTVAVRDVLARR